MLNAPWRIPLMTMLVVALALAGCGGDAGGAGGGGADVEDLPDRAAASSEDAEGTTYPLAPGRYRMQYRAPGCTGLVVSIQGVDHEFDFERTPRGFVSFVDDLPGGEYEISVASECEEWTIDLAKF